MAKWCFLPARDIARFCIGGFALLYPIGIFLAVVVFDVPVNYLSLFIIVFAVIYLVINLSSEEKRASATTFISPILLCLIGLTGFFLNSHLAETIYPALAGKSKDVIKLYPLLVNAAWLVVFGSGLIKPPTFVFEIVILLDKQVKNGPAEQPIVEFSRRATVVWCVFFLIDSILAWFTVFGPLVTISSERFSDTLWGIYNGAVTYIAMGVIFILQFIMAKKIIRQYVSPRRPPYHAAD